MEKMHRFNLQRFAEEQPLEGGGEEQKFTIGDQEYTTEQLVELKKSYDKLQSQFTKVSQENSELKKTTERAKVWLDYEEYLGQYPQEVIEEYTKLTNDFFVKAAQGTVTQKDITGFNKAIRGVEKVDPEKADQMRDERDEALAELMVDKEIVTLGKEARKDGIDFDEDDFKAYLAKYLEDEDLVDENGEFDTREIRRAYKAYKLDQKEKALSKPPAVGTGGSGIGAGKGKDKGPKNLKEAHQRYMGNT